MPRTRTETANGSKYPVTLMNRLLAAAGYRKTKKNRQTVAKLTYDKSGDNELQKREIDAALRLIKGLGDAKPAGARVKIPRTTITTALGNIPWDIAENYDLDLGRMVGDEFREGRSTESFRIDPPEVRRRPVGASRTRGAVVRDSERGGKIVDLGDGKYHKGGWTRTTLRQIASSSVQIRKLENAGYDLDLPRNVLITNSKENPNPVVFAFKDPAEVPPRRVGFRQRPWRGFAIICTDVQTATFTQRGRPPGPPIVARKPVIYIYPEGKAEHVRVEVNIDGDFVTQYPKPNAEGGAWEVIANTDGTLFDPKNERKYGYLFWEGTNEYPWQIDAAEAYCVKSDDVEAFLEKACVAYGLNDKEKTDFVSYWIAHMEQNPVNLVRFLGTEEYEDYAQMKVTPEPETTIRMFMVFQAIPEVIETGSPELPQMLRKGYTVVEWGGANLDEVAK